MNDKIKKNKHYENNEGEIQDNKNTFDISNNIGEKRKERFNKRIKQFQDKNL